MKRSFFSPVMQFVHRLSEDAVSAYAAQAAFFILISCFPFAMLLITLLQVLPFSQPELLQHLTTIFPASLTNLVETLLQDIWDRSLSNVTVISITAVTTVWASSKGFFALTQGLNAVYRIERRRPWLIQKLLSALYTVVFAVLLIVTLVLLVFGNDLYKWIVSVFPAVSEYALLVISVRSFASFAILAIFFLLLYLFIPNRRFRKEHILTELPGALISAFGWIGFSYLYAHYIDYFGENSNVYGSLTAVVLLMLWLYFCMYIMLVGAEINAVLQTDLYEPLAAWWKKRRERRRQKEK